MLPIAAGGDAPPLDARETTEICTPHVVVHIAGMGSAKRHHYLPEFYLAGFTPSGTRDDAFVVFDRDECQYRRQTPKNTTVRGYYYAVEDPETGAKSMHVEEFLSGIEGEAEPVIRKLERREQPTDHEREVLAVFCALLHTRVPQFDRSVQEMFDRGLKEVNRRVYSTMEEVAAHREEWERETGEAAEPSVEEAFQMLQTGNYTVVQPRQNVIKLMLQVAGDIAEWFLNMDWAIGYVPPKMTFITTDAPLLLIPPRDWQPGMRAYGLATPGAHKMIPLSRGMAAFIGDRGRRFDLLALSKGQVRQNNLALAAHAERFLLGPDEALVRFLVRRTSIDTAPRRPLVVVE